MRIPVFWYVTDIGVLNVRAFRRPCLGLTECGSARLHKVLVISTAELLLFSYDSASWRQLQTPELPVVKWTFETGFEIPESRIQGHRTWSWVVEWFFPTFRKIARTLIFKRHLWLWRLLTFHCNVSIHPFQRHLTSRHVTSSHVVSNTAFSTSNVATPKTVYTWWQFAVASKQLVQFNALCTVYCRQCHESEAP